MQIKITSRDVSLPASVTAYIEGKADKLSKFNGLIQEVRVVASLKDRQAHLEAIADVEHGEDLVATAATDDFLASADQAFDRLAGQLAKLHGKLSDHHREPLKQASANAAGHTA